ncbi:TMEM165/GDT1 family protein [Candidatus Bathyarchaeota archaeon]|nr:TMEM165/GDT1 family protein [Candidatus Bathyarchaeota archaeon]
MDLIPFLAAFSFIFLAELGDKTQLAVITLCSRHNWKVVLSGAMLSFALIDGLSVLVGRGIAEVVPLFWIQIIGGVMFIAFGLYILLHKERENESFRLTEKSSGFISTLILISFAELGDKTQLAVIALAAEYAEAIMVFLGIISGFLAITIIGVLIGKGLIHLVPQKYLKLVSAVLFIGFGIIFLLQPIVFT